MIKNIRLFDSGTEKAIYRAKLVKRKLISNDFNVVEDDNYDLAVAVGGDGSFIRMVKNNNFNENIFYVGVNAGHLGYLQEVKDEDIDKFIDALKDNSYKICDIRIQETVVNHINGEDRFNSINEIIVKPKENEETEGVLVAQVYVDNGRLQSFHGDGIMIATPTGSTGHALSAKGPIIDPDLNAQVMVPMNPIFSSEYHSLINPVVVSGEKPIKISPENKIIKVVVDAKPITFEKVDTVTVTMNKKVKCLRFGDYNFAEKLNEKFLR